MIYKNVLNFITYKRIKQIVFMVHHITSYTCHLLILLSQQNVCLSVLYRGIVHLVDTETFKNLLYQIS